MKKQYKVLTAFIIFSFFIVVPAYFIADSYGLTETKISEPIYISASLHCPFDGAYVDMSPQGRDVLVALTFHTPSNTTDKCDTSSLYFGKTTPSSIEIFDGSDIAPRIKQQRDGDYELQIAKQYDETFTSNKYVFRYRNIIHKTGLSTYGFRATFRIGIVTSSGHHKSHISFLLPSSLTNKEIIPEQASVEIEKDAIIYRFPDKTQTFIAKWEDTEEAETNILLMLLLSALFGVGISGLMEVIIGFMKLEEDTNR